MPHRRLIPRLIPHLALYPALFFALLCLPAQPLLAAGGAGADQPGPGGSQLQVALTIYAGGVTVGTMDMDATFRGADYHAVSHLKTSGVVNAFWQSEIQATASGKLEGRTFQPALYDSFDTNRSGRRQQVSLSYEGAAPPRLYADPVYSTTGYEVKPEDRANTYDPLSSLIYIVSGAGADPANPCALTAPVFDGRRRYNIEMTKVRDIDIRMDNGLYRGRGVQCAVKYRQIAGFKPNVLNREAFPTINAWLAVMPGAGRTYVVPLRLWADTKFGAVSVVATSLKIDGVTPK